MINLNSEVFQAFQNKLKTGNRRGVHLNAIPGNSRYKFDLARLSEIYKSLPEHFIIHLLTQKSVKFKFSIHDKSPNQSDVEIKKEEIYLFDDEDRFEDSEEESTSIEKDKTIPEPALKNDSREQVLEKLAQSLENLIFQNEVILSEKGVNSLGFGFPILIRKDMNDGQISASPILIWSLQIKPTNEMNTWEISRNEDNPIYLNEVLINHLQSDSGVILEQIPDEMLSDGKIDKPELLSLCETILQQLKITQNLDFLLNNYAEIPAIKTKAYYDTQLPNKGDAFILKSGLFSLFEVQKQNIINDYEVLKSDFKPLESLPNKDFQSISPIETDPSQQGILEALKSQTKILIQGPPGTGKSQTLTAVLVNALENKQKTIVVCEKQTALEVLYNALHKLGLGRYCIMIKDSVSDRKLVVDAVRNTIDPADFKKTAQTYPFQLLQDQLREISAHKENINSVHRILNSDVLPNKNWTEVVGSLLQIQDKNEKIDLQDLTFSYTNEEFNEIEYVLTNGAELYAQFQPFTHSTFLNSEKLIRENFHSSLQQLDTAFQGYTNQYNEIRKLISDFKPNYQEKKKQEFANHLQKFNSLINETEIITSTLPQNSEVYRPETTKSFWFKFLSLFSSTKKKTLQTQDKLQEISRSIKELSLNSLFPSIDISDNLWQNKNEIIIYRNQLQKRQSKFTDILEEHFSQLDFVNYFDATTSGRETETIQHKIQQLRKSISNDQWISTESFGSTYQSFQEKLSSVIDLYDSYRNHPDNPLLTEYNWFQFYQPLSQFQKKCVEKLRSVSNWKSSFLSEYYPLVLNKNADAKLNFNEKEYSEILKKIKQFGFSQKNFIENFWNTSQQNAVKNFETNNKDITVANLYNKRSSTNFRRLTLRQIVQKDCDLFTSFFPIILTTPDACSNLFQGKNFYFDNVVFDEASQLKLEDNLPALLKGKNIVVAGDEHQMPPSNYFSKVFEGTVEDEDDLESDSETITYKNALLNIESLLDFGMENNFEKKHLDFHYRSKHPYLIDFSNRAFYNSRLKPLPAKSDYKPIEFFQIDGTFDEHINVEEAQKVIQLLENIKPLANGDYPSVGIATFNITQRNYIKRSIVQKVNLPENETFKEKIQALEAAGLFIKNLENIQGDERDIIIISTTYGKKPSGKFIQSFGPVNHTKGYKLLNVIITRAKEKIYICNSIPESVFMSYKDALEQEGSNNRKAVFYAYLAYCEAVSEGNETQRVEILKTLDILGFKASSEETDEGNDLVESLYQHLNSKIPDAILHKNHHFGGYVLDLLIEKEGKKSVVVECMSKEKFNGNLGYLEDLHKEKILQNAGYDYVRIWSQNCWQTLDSEIQKIIKKIV